MRPQYGEEERGVPRLAKAHFRIDSEAGKHVQKKRRYKTQESRMISEEKGTEMSTCNT